MESEYWALILLGIGVITCVILAILMDRPKKIELEDERWARVVSLSITRASRRNEFIGYVD